MGRTAVSLEDFRQAARRRLPCFAFDFIDGGADREITAGGNRGAFDRVTFVPRVLRDVSEVETSSRLFSIRPELPVLIAPTGMASLAGRNGDIAGATAAGDAGTVFTLSTMSSDSIEEVAEAAGGPLWFQLYLWSDPEVSEELIGRAERAGFEALVVTVDVPAVGNRLRDRRHGLSVPPKIGLRTMLDAIRHPRWVAQRPDRIRFANVASEPAIRASGGSSHGKLIDRVLANPGATWADLGWLRERWSGPILVKGVLSADDARAAVAHGADGVIVSNHGGRQLDGAIPTIDALPSIAGAVDEDTVVILDGGVRQGSDVAKAICLGANACMIGRPWLFGLAVGGEAGVAAVLDTLRRELERTMRLLGAASLSDLGPDLILGS